MDEERGDVESGLIDLAEMDLGQLMDLDSAVLADVIEAIRDEAEDSDAAVSGFQSSL